MDEQYKQAMIAMDKDYHKEINRMKLQAAKQQVKIDQLEEDLALAKQDNAFTKQLFASRQNTIDVKIWSDSQQEYRLQTFDESFRIRSGKPYYVRVPAGGVIEKNGTVYCEWKGTAWNLLPPTNEGPDKFEVKANNWLHITPRKN